MVLTASRAVTPRLALTSLYLWKALFTLACAQTASISAGIKTRKVGSKKNGNIPTTSVSPRGKTPLDIFSEPYFTPSGRVKSRKVKLFSVIEFRHGFHDPFLFLWPELGEDRESQDLLCKVLGDGHIAF